MQETFIFRFNCKLKSQRQSFFYKQFNTAFIPVADV